MPTEYTSDFELKIRLRRAALTRCHARGRLYIPFCGEGRIARHLNLPAGSITAVDTDIAMLRLWAGFAPESTRYRAPAQTFKRWGDLPFSYGDFDPFGLTGWAALDNFLRTAPLCEEVAIAITDGHYGQYQRYNRPLDWDTLKLGEENQRRTDEQHENFFKEAAIWLYHHPRVKEPKFGAQELSRNDAGLWHASFVLSIHKEKTGGAAAVSVPATSAAWPYRTLGGEDALTGLKKMTDLMNAPRNAEGPEAKAKHRRRPR